MLDSYIPFLSVDSFSPFSQIYPDEYAEYLNNFDSNLYNYPDLSQYINSLGNDILKMLKNSNIKHLIQIHHPQIIKFLCQNIEELILISFDNDEKKDYQSRLAFAILMSGEPLVYDTLSKVNFSILKKMSNIALQRNDNYFALHKLIQLIQFTIQLSYFWEKTFPLTLAFICIFIPYIYEDSIFTFYETICSDVNCFAPVQSWLLEQANFPIVVFDELSKVKTEGLKYDEKEKENDEAKQKRERDLQKAINLLKLISICLKSKILCKEFDNYRFIEILNDDWTCLKISDTLLDELWSAISKLYTRKTSSLMQGLFQKAIELMTESYVTIKRLRIGVIELISKMIIVDETLRPFIIESHIEETVLRLLIQFPGHTFLQNALLSLCSNALEIPEMRFVFAKALISPLIDKSKEESEGKLFMEFTCKFIQKALDVGKNNKIFLNEINEMEGFTTFCKDVIKKRKKLIKNGYGGRLPIFKTKPVFIVS